MVHTPIERYFALFTIPISNAIVAMSFVTIIAIYYFNIT